MSPALLYLLARSLRGRTVHRLRLLRQPKYLVGTLLGALWLGFFLAPALLGGRGPAGGVDVEFGLAFLAESEELTHWLVGAHFLVALAGAALLTLWWLAPWSKPALELTESELHLLMPTPLERRHIIQYSLLKSQPGILFGACLLTLFSGTWALFGAYALVATWMLLTLWDLHAKGRSLWLERLRELPRAQAWRKRLLLFGAMAFFWGMVGTEVWRLGIEIAATFPVGDQDLGAAIGGIFRTYGPRTHAGRLGTALAPFLWLTAPIFATRASGYWYYQPGLALLVPLAALALHHEWAVRSRVRFEEATLEHARREAGKKDPASRYWNRSLRSRRSVPFRLPPRGRPEVAVVWKNQLLVHRMPLRRLVGIGVAGLAAVALALPLAGAPQWVFDTLAIVGFVALAWSPVMAGSMWRNDLRTDLLKSELLRPWPLAGWRLVGAQVLAGALAAALIAALGLGLVLATEAGRTIADVGALLTAEGVSAGREAPVLGVPRSGVLALGLLGAAPLVFGLGLLSSALQNLGVLLFPGWIQLGLQKEQGAASVGQSLLVFSVLGVALLVGLLPSALLVGAVLAVQSLVLGLPLTAWELPLLGLVAAIPPAVLAAAVVGAAGRIWERLDLSREVLGGGGTGG